MEMIRLKTIKDELPFFQKLLKAISAQFGDQCETVLHDYSQEYNHTIIAIENGHVTGRKVGDCGTNLGLEILRGLAGEEDQHNYLTHSKDGKILRSTSVYIHSDDDKIIGSVCINWDVSDFVYSANVIGKLANVTPAHQVHEIMTDNVSDLLDALIQDSFSHVGKPIVSMSKEEKILGLKYLDKKGAFLVKRASDRVAKVYGISKNTLYNYLEKYQQD
jgi:predicted transcriptional regulator YheO